MSRSSSVTKGSPRPPLGLAWRLFAAVGLVVIGGAGTMVVSVLLTAHPAFRSHLDQIQPPLSPQAQTHVDEAFAGGVFSALSLSVTAALAVALVVTWLVAQRVAAPITKAAEAAYRVADGDYETRLPQPRLGPEFDRLTTSFNTMARRLADTEQTRRRLLTDLAHELRTPLASMQATIEAITDGILPSDASTLATLTEQSQRLHRLVNDLSAVSRAEERQLNLNPIPVSLSDIVITARAGAQARCEAKGISLIADLAHATGKVLVDPDRLAEALGALLDNASRHTAPGGTVTIRATRHGNQCRIAVTDNGVGFEPAVTHRLFERFYRGDPSRSNTSSGSGIGLTIARAIIQAHHGQLRANSKGPGYGATFEITLPSPDQRSTPGSQTSGHSAA